MNPTALVSLSADMLRERARHDIPARPVATSAERLWAGVACVVVMALGALLIVATR